MTNKITELIAVLKNTAAQQGDRIEAANALASSDSEDAINALSEVLLDSGENNGVRYACVHALANTDTVAVIEPLLAALNDHRSSVKFRDNVAYNLCQSGKATSLAVLVRALDGDIGQNAVTLALLNTTPTRRNAVLAEVDKNGSPAAKIVAMIIRSRV